MSSLGVDYVSVWPWELKSFRLAGEIFDWEAKTVSSYAMDEGAKIVTAR